jgi:hypothetical protein
MIYHHRARPTHRGGENARLAADLRGQWPLDAHQLRHADQVDLARQITLEGVADDLSSRIECVACAHAYAVDGMFIRN